MKVMNGGYWSPGVHLCLGFPETGEDQHKTNRQRPSATYEMNSGDAGASKQ
jgi:hypothetical protein